MKTTLVFTLLFINIIFADDITMTFNGTSTTMAGVIFSFSPGTFTSSSDGTMLQLFDNHPYANMINGGEDYKDINISESILITSINVTWAINIQGFILQFLNNDIVVKELSSLTTGNISVNTTANKIRFLDSGSSSSGGFELASVSWDGVLPVELVSFAAEQLKNETILHWQTATEINNYGFEIEKQNVEEKFEWVIIGFAEGHGNSNSPKTYSFSDKSCSYGKFLYRLKQIDIDGSFQYSNIIEIDNGLPNKTELLQNFPNPFNPITNISFTLNTQENVNLDIYNTIGKKVLTLIDENKEVGIHNIKFDGNILPSGIYFYTLTAGSFIETKRMTLLK